MPILIILLIIPSFVSADEVSIGAGVSFNLNHEDPNPGENGYTISYMRGSDFTYGVKYLTYQGDTSGSYLAALVGYSFDVGKWSFVPHMGVGYLDKPDGEIVITVEQIDENTIETTRDEQGRLTNNIQFNLALGIHYNIVQAHSIGLRWDHLSNCQQICSRGESNSPNVGRDFILLNYTYDF